MTHLGVASASAVSEPRTAATATTAFPRFRDDAALGAHGTDGRRRGCWYSLVEEINKNRKTIKVIA